MRVAVAATLTTAFLAACGTGEPTALPAKTVTVVNYLNVAYNLVGYMGGQRYPITRVPAAAAVPGSVTFEVPRRLAVILGTPERLYNSAGQQMITAVGLASLDVSAAVQPYAFIDNGTSPFINFTPMLQNNTGVPLQLGVVAGGAFFCVTSIAPGQTSVAGYYWRSPDAEVRYYATSDCTGAYRSFPSDTIAAHMAPRSGFTLLRADSLP